MRNAFIGALILFQVGFVVGLIVGQLLAAHSAG